MCVHPYISYLHLLVRLIGGNSASEGEVEIYDRLSYRWEKLCDDGWNFKAATVVCRQLNLGPPISISSHIVGNGSEQYGLEIESCNGRESNIGQCAFTTSHDCHVDEIAAVKCSKRKCMLY